MTSKKSKNDKRDDVLNRLSTKLRRIRQQTTVSSDENKLRKEKQYR